MIKFLKFVLFVVIIAFAFALGVKFSGSFKGDVGNLHDDELVIKDEMDKAFNDTKEEIYRVMDRHDMEEERQPLTHEDRPLTEEEKNEVKNIDNPDFEDINVIEPMDNIGNDEIGVFIEEDQMPTSNDAMDNSVHTVEPMNLTTEMNTNNQNPQNNTVQNPTNNNNSQDQTQTTVEQPVITNNNQAQPNLNTQQQVQQQVQQQINNNTPQKVQENTMNQ